jgi:hypothetical protein
MHTSRYLGFYWTLPVPWAGFGRLPKDVDEAARLSRTIRYQRDRVRRWVAEQRGELVAEHVFLELEPDRGSEQIVPELDRVVARCGSEDATLVLVDFSSEFGWRRHGPLWERLDSADVRCDSLDPTPLLIDGAAFDPVQHFRYWRQLEQAHAESKPQRKAALADAIDRLGNQHATHAALAEALNAGELFTPNGKPWTADNLRKFIKAL